jgi:pimeloyl-ACP methyl ester carboxylesterase
MKLSRTLMLVGGLLAVSPAVSFAETTPAVHNVVLVHGAFADQTSWDKVAEILRKKGYNVTEVANPLTSLQEDVAATEAVIKKQAGPVVLVGHSWGGVVIGEAGADPKVQSLVYVAAFAPDKGESVQALGAGSPPTPGIQALRPDDKGFLSIDAAAFPTVFAGSVAPNSGQ